MDKFFVHSFRFSKVAFVSLSRNRGLGKGTAFGSPSPANSVESLSSFSLFGVNPKVRHFIIRRFSVCQDYFQLADDKLRALDVPNRLE